MSFQVYSISKLVELVNEYNVCGDASWIDAVTDAYNVSQTKNIALLNIRNSSTGSQWIGS